MLFPSLILLVAVAEQWDGDGACSAAGAQSRKVPIPGIFHRWGDFEGIFSPALSGSCSPLQCAAWEVCSDARMGWSWCCQHPCPGAPIHPAGAGPAAGAPLLPYFSTQKSRFPEWLSQQQQAAEESCFSSGKGEEGWEPSPSSEWFALSEELPWEWLTVTCFMPQQLWAESQSGLATEMGLLSRSHPARSRAISRTLQACSWHWNCNQG